MNIVFISNEYPLWAPGGKGTFIQTFARALVAAGHQATVVGIGDTSSIKELEDEGVRLIRLRKPLLPKAKFIENFARIRKKIKELHAEHPVDIVETSELDCAYVSKNPPYKKIIRLHGGHHFFAEGENRGIDPIKGEREIKSFANADAFIAVSNYVKEHTATLLSYGEAMITTINYPVDTEIEVPDVLIDENKILFAGTICEKKGVNQLIAAFQPIRTKFPKKELHIFGRDWFFPDGSSYTKMLEEKYGEAGLEGVLFHGSISREQLYREYASASFCIFPSHMETQGLVTLEALLMERPVIFSQYGPGPETIIHLEDGLLCDVYKPEDIAEKMMWMIEHPEKAKEMALLGKSRVNVKFNKDAKLKDNIAFYTAVCSK